jgi:osmotically-inducible protein OsmY
MEQDIRDGLVRTLGMDADRIKVEIDGGTVVLSGAVGSWMEREQAQRVAWSAPGVRAVEDRLTVAT